MLIYRVMRQFRFRFVHVLLLLISMAFYLKVRRVAQIQAFLAQQSGNLGNQEQMAEYERQFKEAFGRIESGPPAILLLNKFALKISVNFLCNLRKFPNAVGRVVAVTFDSHSHDLLKKSFPEIGIVHWHLPELEQKFSSGDGRYQLFQYFRAKLASLLTGITKSFWMVQADTIWRENLFQIINLDSGEFADADLVFDSEGSEGLLRSMVAGGYFFVRSSDKTKQFFDGIAQFLLEHFATDNNVMARQCILGSFGNKCAQIPYSVISNWRISSSQNAGTSSSESSEELWSSSSLFQFDGGEGAGDKFERMRTKGLLFVDPDTVPANEGAQNPVKCFPDNGGEADKKESPEQSRKSWSNHFISFVHSSFELAYAKFPALKEFLLAELFPFYAAYLFI